MLSGLQMLPELFLAAGCVAEIVGTKKKCKSLTCHRGALKMKVKRVRRKSGSLSSPSLRPRAPDEMIIHPQTPPVVLW